MASPVARSEAEKCVPLQPILHAVETASADTAAAYRVAREQWLDVLLAGEREERPSFSHVAGTA